MKTQWKVFYLPPMSSPKITIEIQTATYRETICTMQETNTRNRERISAHAQKIVQCVNHHEPLKKALKDCLACLTMDSDAEEDFKKEIKQARKVLEDLNK